MIDFKWAIDWFITTKCNDSCRFCYAPMEFKEYNFSLKEYYLICKKIKELGFSRVTICGGEPTLNKYIIYIISCLKEFGLEIVFYSNGIHLPVIKQIVDKIDILSLPIDSIKGMTNKCLRSEEQIKNVFKCLDYLECIKYPNLKVKIGTVVNKYNILDIESIYEEIVKYSVIKYWRLYQFSPAEKGKIYKSEYEITDYDFNMLKSQMKDAINLKLSVSFRSRTDNIGYCIIIDQGGKFYRYEEKYIELGTDVFNTDIETILNNYNINQHLLQKKWIDGNIV